MTLPFKLHITAPKKSLVTKVARHTVAWRLPTFRRAHAVLVTELTSYGQEQPVALAFFRRQTGMAFYPLEELADIE